jgi:threonine synthase
MGLPIGRILVATNSNDILARTFESGRYERGQVQATISPAMDIQSASNFERLYFESVGRDADATAQAFAGFAETGAIQVPPAAFTAMRGLFGGLAVSEAETMAAIGATLDESGELIDPHTAVAVAALGKADGLEKPIVVLSTAHPAKFPEDVAKASGVVPGLPRGVADLADRPERFDRLAADAEAIKAFIRTFAGA